MDTKTILKSGGILRVTDTYLGISFEKERFSLSTAIFGGGFKKINHAVNQKLTVFYPSPENSPADPFPNISAFPLLTTDMLRKKAPLF